jgi:MFS family permease
MSLYSPVLATYRLEHTPRDRLARTLSAWSISSGASIAIFSALGGLLADATGPRTARGRGAAHSRQPAAAAQPPGRRPTSGSIVRFRR